MENTFYQRIDKLCKEQGISINVLEKGCQFSRGTIGKWNKNTIPMIDKVEKIAEYFHVSVDYLLGRTDIREPIDQVISDPEIISMQRKKSNSTPGQWEFAYKMFNDAWNYSNNQNDH